MCLVSSGYNLPFDIFCNIQWFCERIEKVPIRLLRTCFIPISTVRNIWGESNKCPTHIPVSILHKSIAGRCRPVRVADGPIMARCRFIKNASWDVSYFVSYLIHYVIDKPWLLSRFWVYCKLYHSLVTFHCLTPNEAEPSLGQTVKGHQIMI